MYNDGCSTWKTHQLYDTVKKKKEQYDVDNE